MVLIVEIRKDLLSDMTLGFISEFILNKGGAFALPGDTPVMLSARFTDAGDAGGIIDPRLFVEGFSHGSVFGFFSVLSGAGARGT